MAKQSNEQRYFDALQRIVRYAKPDWILKHGEKEWGLPGGECLRDAYENIQIEAKSALGRRRRPQD
jgi:hypothetical protein